MSKRTAFVAVSVSLGMFACGNHPPDPPITDGCGLMCFDVPRVDAFDAAIDTTTMDTGTMRDAGSDAANIDAARTDARPTDAGDAGDASDAGVFFDAQFDVGVDAPRDAGRDARTDVVVDTANTNGCVSGAAGNYVARFSWQGSQGSTAYPRYEMNTLPDSSRWNVSAASTSIGYSPIYDDTFLGPGGFDLETPAFMDVQLSTVGLSAIRAVTIAIYGRSFSTGASGSFSWQTFTGNGATPANLVANSTPYRWYAGDATIAFVPDDNTVLLRVRPGASSNALIVNRVEICFDAL